MMNLFFPAKKTLIILSFIIVGIVLLAFISAFSSGQPTQLTASPSPKPQSSMPTSNLPPLSSSISNNNEKSIYTSQDLEKDFQRIENKKPLDSSDAAIKNQLISSLGDKSNYLIQTPNYKIEYVKGPNLFMIELLSSDLEAAKKESLQWFYSKGLSPKGVCDLPVLIYVNYNIASSLAQKDIIFNPIPEDCQ